MGSSFVGKIEGLLGERRLQESQDLVQLSAGALHALSARGFRWAEDWNASPGGRIALPASEKSSGTKPESVGGLLRALESGAWKALGEAKTFEFRLTDLSGNRTAVILRRLHRESEYPVSLDLTGKWTRRAMHDLTGSLSSRLPVANIVLTKFQYC